MQCKGDKVILKQSDLERLSHCLIERVSRHETGHRRVRIYGIPRGGVPVAYLLASKRKYEIVDDPGLADVFVDDIIASGKTKKHWANKYPDTPMYALIDRILDREEYGNEWFVFPWEGTAEGSIQDNFVRILQYVGEDPARPGLLETPMRVAKAWQEWTEGYKKDPSLFLKVFEDGAENYDQIVVMKNIPFYSHCEHHMTPFFGVAHVGYIPNKKIVGLSKLVELVHCFAKRLQVQERLTCQVADALMEHLDAKGSGCVTDARHLCMESRGKKSIGQSTPMSAFRGIMLSDTGTKAEFLSLTR